MKQAHGLGPRNLRSAYRLLVHMHLSVHIQLAVGIYLPLLLLSSSCVDNLTALSKKRLILELWSVL
jgi:hypothetical protein